MANDIIHKIAATLEARKTADPDTSYVAKLYAKGLEKILEKISEEANETIIAAKDEDKNAIIHETADLWFHTLVMLAYSDLSPDHVLTELERRFGTSGIEEKANRIK